MGGGRCPKLLWWLRRHCNTPQHPFEVLSSTYSNSSVPLRYFAIALNLVLLSRGVARREDSVGTWRVLPQFNYERLLWAASLSFSVTGGYGVAGLSSVGGRCLLLG